MTNDELAKSVKAEAAKIISKIEAILSEVKRLGLNTFHIPAHEQGETDEANSPTDKSDVKPSLGGGEGFFSALNGAHQTENTKEAPPQET